MIKIPIVDKPLEELQKYQGTNPCPQDIDEFWDQALLEMRSLDTDVEIIPADFNVPFADCFHLYFKGLKGARIHAKYLKPKNCSEPHPAVLQFHGYSVSSGDWNNKLNYVAAGFSVAALDCRGQGGLSEDIGAVKGNTFYGHIIRGLADSPENLLYRQIFLDTAQLARIIMNRPEVDERYVAAMGASQGGGLTLACGALEPRIRRLVPLHSFLCDYKRVWDMDLAKNAYAEIKDYFKKYDPLHQKEDEIFTRLGYIDVQNLVKRIRGEVLMGIGLMDETCPPSTQFAAYNKIKAPKQLLIYPDYPHGDIPGFWDKAFNFICRIKQNK